MEDDIKHQDLENLDNLEVENTEEAGFGKGSSDGTEGFGDMLYKGMDEMYKKHGKDSHTYSQTISKSDFLHFFQSSIATS